MPCKCTSLLLQQTSTATLLAFFQNFLKSMHALRVNQTKLHSGNTSTVAVFALGYEKNRNMKKEHSCGTVHGIMTCLLIFNFPKMYICVFQYFLRFNHFLSTSSSLLKLRFILLNARLYCK